MKLSHKLGGAALVALAGVSLAVPSTTKANSIAGKGHIGFTEQTGKPTITDNSTSTDSGGSTGTGTTITDNSTFTITDPGTFGIFAVTPLEFETHSVLTASQENFNASLYDNGNNVKTANLVSFLDKRADKRDYKLSAQLTQQFKSAAGKELNGSTIEYKNTWINSYANSVAANGLAASGVVATTGSTPFITNNAGATDAGYGQHDLVFGEKAGAANADKSVTLTIPKAQNAVVVAGDYNAVITWTLSETV
ncbi:WxL domain-containing protein [uncultured Enterococcus sp.]|uniref:WxL domain-containing protein n=1 Tax=uncultured Enterococcus sp. TaxID=167972 RepID=UPI002AA7CC2C|nr:WxL domain-containing protein [uncultured Enterococcus sp.]